LYKKFTTEIKHETIFLNQLITQNTVALTALNIIRLITNNVLTYSMQNSPWEGNRFSDSRKIPNILWKGRFITSLTNARHLSLS